MVIAQKSSTVIEKFSGLICQSPGMMHIEIYSFPLISDNESKHVVFAVACIF